MTNIRSKPTILFLNDNPLPSKFSKGTISGKELRLRAAIKNIGSITAIGFRGHSLHHHKKPIGYLERKIHTILIPKWPYYLRSLPLFIYGLYYFHKLKPSTIEAESPIISGIAAIVIGKLTKTPVIVEVRASYHELIKIRLPFISLFIKRYLLNCVLHFVYQRSTKIISNSNQYASEIKHLGYKAIVINPGLQYLPGTIPPKPKQVIIGYLGRLVPEKGIEILIKCIDILIKSGINQFTVEIAGQGPHKAKLRSLVRSLKLNSVIKFVGFTNNYQTLSKWSILVNPNIVDHPLEMVNAEAASMGVPVICFGNNTFPETVIHRQTGLKLSKKSPTALSQAITTLINNPQLRQQYSARSISFARNKYNMSTQIDHLKNLYYELGIIS